MPEIFPFINMKFSKYCFLHIKHEDRDILKKKLLTIDENLSEYYQLNEKNILYITNEPFILENYKTNYFYITPDAIHEIYKSNLKEFPFYFSKQLTSICLLNKIFLISLLSKEKVIEIDKYIKLLGGNIISNENLNYDFLISNSSFSKKVLNSYLKKIPVISPNFIIDIYRIKKIDDLILNFKLPLFQGFNITTTDLSLNIKKNLQNLIISNGGIFSEELTENTNILLTNKLSTTNKIKIALKENMPIINYKWIFDSINEFKNLENYCLNKWIFEGKSKLFEGISFNIHLNIELIDIIVEAIKYHSGEINLDPNYIIVPNSNFENFNFKNVTINWLWDCIYYNKILDIQSSIIYYPFKFENSNNLLKNQLFSILITDENIKFEIIEIIRNLGGLILFRESKKSNFLISDSIKNLNLSNNNIKLISIKNIYNLALNGNLNELFNNKNLSEQIIIPIISKSHSIPTIENNPLFSQSLNSFTQKNSQKNLIFYEKKSIINNYYNNENDPLFDLLDN